MLCLANLVGVHIVHDPFYGLNGYSGLLSTVESSSIGYSSWCRWGDVGQCPVHYEHFLRGLRCASEEARLHEGQHHLGCRDEDNPGSGGVLRSQARRHLRAGDGAAAPELPRLPPVPGRGQGLRLREDPLLCEEAAGCQVSGAMQGQPVDARAIYQRLFQAKDEAVPRTVCSIFTRIYHMRIIVHNVRLTIALGKTWVF